MNICLNCSYFLNCEESSKEKTKCNKYVKIQRTIEKIEDSNFKFKKLEE